MVYMGSISLYPVLSLRTEPFGLIDIFAIIITATAIILEALADQQLYKFRRNRENSQEFITTGLWKERDIKKMHGVDKVFKPRMSKGEKEKLYKGWQKAVERAL